MLFFFSRVGIVLSDSEHNYARSYVLRVTYNIYYADTDNSVLEMLPEYCTWKNELLQLLYSWKYWRSLYLMVWS